MFAFLGGHRVRLKTVTAEAYWCYPKYYITFAFPFRGRVDRESGGWGGTTLLCLPRLGKVSAKPTDGAQRTVIPIMCCGSVRRRAPHSPSARENRAAAASCSPRGPSPRKAGRRFFFGGSPSDAVNIIKMRNPFSADSSFFVYAIVTLSRHGLTRQSPCFAGD